MSTEEFQNFSEFQNKKPLNDFSEVVSGISEFTEFLNSALKDIENEQEEFWNALSKAEQLKVFCCVSRRVFDAEIKDQRSYRAVLYNTFGFGPESYVQAQDAGYLAIHNSIFDGNDDSKCKQLLEFLGYSEETTQRLFSEFTKKMYF